MTKLEMKVDALVRIVTAADDEARRAAMEALAKLEPDDDRKRERDYEIMVQNILIELGVPTGIRGYGYLRDGILMAINNPGIVREMTKTFYPEIGNIHNTTGSRVARCVRHAIEACWSRGDYKVHEDYFGGTVSYTKGTPTAREFVTLIAERIRMGNAKSW